MNPKCIVIGASHAGAQFVTSLRQGGWEGDITLVGDEKDLPYQRPPLSKGYLYNQEDLEKILIRPSSAYNSAGINMKLGTRITSIDRFAKTISTNRGETLIFDKLVLATGARVRTLDIPGADDPRVFYLRDINDVKAIKAAISPQSNAVIVGGGYIGLEAAATMRKLGINVIVLEAMERILERVTAPVMSNFYRRIHTEEGVIIKENEVAAYIESKGDKISVNTKSGASYPADFIIIGIGVIPNTELAADAGLDVSNGVVVNEFCQTNDPDIYAIGDITWHYNRIYRTYLRLESVPNATEQAKTAAMHINGNPMPHDSLPWFWSDQFDLKLQIAGLSRGYDDIIIRGDSENSRSFAAYYFKGDRLLGVDAVNSPRDFMMARTTLRKGKTLDKTRLANTSENLKALIQ